MIREYLPRKLMLVGLLCLLALTQPMPARAVLVLATDSHQQWLIICNDGISVTLPWNAMSYPDILDFATDLCQNHSGVANITDTGVVSALNTIQTCNPSSSIALAKDLGGGNYEALTADDLRALAEQSQGQPVPLTGYELRSVIVGGTELHPNAVRNLPSISMDRIYSDQNGDGQFVGGRTNPDSCFALPLTPAAMALIGLLLAGLAATSIARRPRPGQA